MSDALNHNGRQHALLSASGASRWMNCTPSARKEEHLGEQKSVYALEGTLAHELAETELRLHFKHITVDEYRDKIVIIESNDLYSSDMPEFVDVYVQYCIDRYEHYKSICASVEISIEDKIDLTEYIPDGFGSNDFVIIADNFIEVIDLKYGRGVSVSAVDNPQLKLYGLGSVFKHRLSYNMNEIQLTVVQPRTNSISTFVLTVDELEEWADTEVVVKARMAHEGVGELNPGEWCKFCKFKPKCKAIYDQNAELMQNDFRDVNQLTDEQLMLVFERSDQIISWVDSVKAVILSRLMDRKPVPGYKLVGGRTMRKLVESEELVNNLKDFGLAEEDFMSQPKLLGITAIEKAVGKKDFQEAFSRFVIKTEPKPTIAKSDDQREDFFSGAENDFLV